MTHVKVEITDRGAIYVNDSRITGRDTKWGVHTTLDSFTCPKDEVVKTCLERGHTCAVRSIDEDYYSKQRDEK